MKYWMGFLFLLGGAQAVDLYAKADGPAFTALVSALKSFEHSGITFNVKSEGAAVATLVPTYQVGALPPFNPDAGSRTLVRKNGERTVQVNPTPKGFVVVDVWRSEAARLLGLDEGMYLKGTRTITEADRTQIKARYGSSGDLNSDGNVDLSDLAILAANYGKTGLGTRGDLNADGRVDAADVTLFSQLYTFK
ncbi:MAG: hypothetical protein U0Z75_06615 [Deinococcaceae bacterium]